MRKIVILITLFLLFLHPLSFGAKKKPHSSPTKKLPFSFGGKFIFELPILPDHLKFKGNIQLFDFAFKGDLELHIISRKPLKIEFSSQKIIVKTSKILKILKKLNVIKKLNLPVGGITVVEGFKLKLDEKKCSIHIARIYGTRLCDYFVSIQKVLVNSNLNLDSIYYKINKIKIDKNELVSLEGEYKTDSFLFKFLSFKLSLNSITNIFFKTDKNLKLTVLNSLKKHIHLTDFYLNGESIIQNFKVKLSLKNKSQNFTINDLNFKLNIPNARLTILNKKKNTVLFCKNKDLNFNYKNKVAHLNLSSFHANIKNIFYPVKSDFLNTKDLLIPEFDFSTSLTLKFKTEDGFKTLTCLDLDGLLRFLPFVAKLDDSSFIKFFLKPIKVSIKNNILKSNLSLFSLSIPQKIEIKIKDSDKLTANGRLNIKDVTTLFDLKKGLETLGLSVKIESSNFRVNYDGLKINTVNLFSDLILNNQIVNIKKFHIKSFVNRNGKITLDTAFKFPVNSVDYSNLFKDLFIKLTVNNVNYKYITVFSANILKKTLNKADLKYNLKVNDLKITGNGYISQQKNVISIITRNFHIKDKSLKTNDNLKSKKYKSNFNNVSFDIKIPTFVLNFSKQYHFAIDKLTYSTKDKDYEIDNFKSDLKLKSKDAFLYSSEFYFCNFNISAGAELNKGGLDTILEVKALSSPIDLIIGCFLSKAPIYIKGDSSIQINVMGGGKTVKELIDNLSFDGVITLDSGIVLKLSNLGKKVGLILDVLHFVKLNPSKLKDALPFDRLVISFNGSPKEVNIKTFQLNSPVINLSSWGKVDLKKYKITFSGIVKKGFIKKSFNITQTLNKKTKR